MEKINRAIEEIENELLEMSSHFKEFYRKDNGDSTENQREEEAFGKLKVLVQNMYLNLHALGDENVGFKSDYSDRVDDLKLRVIEHQAVSLRLQEVIKELEAIQSRYRRVRKRRLLNIIVDTGIIHTKSEANGIIQEGGEASFMRELQLIEGVNAAESIRLRIEDHEKLEERISFLKKLSADTKVVTEGQESLITETRTGDNEKRTNLSGKIEIYFNYFKVFLLFMGLTMVVACVVVGVCIRVQPQWFGLPKTFSPGSDKGSSKETNQPPNAAEMTMGTNLRVAWYASR